MAPSSWGQGRHHRKGHGRHRRGGNIFKKIWHGVKKAWNNPIVKKIRHFAAPWVSKGIGALASKYGGPVVGQAASTLSQSALGSGRRRHGRGIHKKHHRKHGGTVFVKHHKRRDPKYHGRKRRGRGLAVPSAKLLSV